jgi:toxin-antitoxin system PIN domain toxin
VIAVDTNLLIYAHRSDSPWHTRALAALESLGDRRWGIPWPCLHEFLAIATHPKIFSPPTPAADALSTVDTWRESPSLELLGETSDHWAELTRLVLEGRVTGPRVHDARIAALCLEHGVEELWTADRDFSRHPRLRTRNPLVS